MANNIYIGGVEYCAGGWGEYELTRRQIEHRPEQYYSSTDRISMNEVLSSVLKNQQQIAGGVPLGFNKLTTDYAVGSARFNNGKIISVKPANEVSSIDLTDITDFPKLMKLAKKYGFPDDLMAEYEKIKDLIDTPDILEEKCIIFINLLERLHIFLTHYAE